ncbi:MAG: bacterial Ig-like domain-containing protein, partial [Christensenella sp.]|uniref:bacterial Ig-like domain-containing protein n=1 Tax=Christensenella sp. TaxID=1935934 RepID=UPI002B1F4FEC
MKNSWASNKKIKRIITVIVAIAVMVGMMVPTVAMESDNEPAAQPLVVEDTFAESSSEPAANDNDSEKEAESSSEEAATDEDNKKEQEDSGQEIVTDENTGQPEDKVEEQGIKDMLTPFLPSLDTASPFAIIDLDETMIYPGVKVLWYNKNGTTANAPAGASITAVLMDKGPQDSYADWTASQNRLGTSKNTEVLNAGNDFDGWFDNIIKMRSKKLVVSGVPEGYTVTYDDNKTTNEYPSGYDPEYFYINLTKSEAESAALTKIEITSPPSKTSYMEGEFFSKTGMVVKATYSDNTSRTITTYSYNPMRALVESDTQVTVTYTEDGVTKTATTPITVMGETQPELDVIYVTEEPTKTTYTVGEAFDPSGMEVTAYYLNGGEPKVLSAEEYTVSAPDMSTSGIKTVTVTYVEDGVEKSTTFEIIVLPAAVVLDSIAVTTPPVKTTYTEGESFSSMGMVVTATYSDSTTAPVTGYTYSPNGALGTAD